MKKILLTAIVAIVSVATYGQDSFGFTTITPGANQYFLATGLSNNGKYVVGWCGSGAGVALYDVEAETFYYYLGTGAEMSAVTNDGLMVGYSYTKTTVLAYNPITGEEIVDSSVTDLWGKNCTSDGSLIVGTYWDSAWRGHPCYWVDGVCHHLTEPSAEEIEFGFVGDEDEPANWSYEYAESVDCADDGSVICGNVYGWELNGGALIWRLNDEGDYDLDPICAGLVESEWSGDHPYYQYQATAISPNGKYMAMYLQNNDGTLAGGYTYMGRYDVETGEMETAYYTGKGDCTPARIADDGTIVGWSGDQSSQSRTALIWEPGEEIMLLADKYPEAKEIKQWDEDQDWNFPVGITPEKRYIAGGGWHYFEGEGEDYARYASWIFDTEKYALALGIHEVSASDVQTFSGEDEYYSLDGKKLNAPQKGINILRANGKTYKVVVQ